MKMNNKKRQSCLFKQKAIFDHIKQSIDEQRRVSFGFIYANNQLYERFQAPTNIHYGYKVIKYCYHIFVEDMDKIERVKGIIKPIYYKYEMISQLNMLL